MLHQLMGPQLFCRVLEDGIKDGAIKVVLENPGSGMYFLPKLFWRAVDSIQRAPLPRSRYQ